MEGQKAGAGEGQTSRDESRRRWGAGSSRWGAAGWFKQGREVDAPTGPSHPTPGMSERERQVMKKLKEVVDKQRDEIRAKDRELGLKNEDVEAVSAEPRPCVRPPGQWVPARDGILPSGRAPSPRRSHSMGSVGWGSCLRLEKPSPETVAVRRTLGRVFTGAVGGNMALPSDLTLSTH